MAITGSEKYPYQAIAYIPLSPYLCIIDTSEVLPFLLVSMLFVKMPLRKNKRKGIFAV